MFDIQKFEGLEKEICDFAKRVDEQVKVHYEGPFITGKLEKPEILFLSINPGGGNGVVTEKDFERVNFIHLNKKYPLAIDLENVFGKNTLEKSCETYIKSFFATKDEKALDELLNRFRDQNSKLLDEHEVIMTKMLKLVIEQIEPKIIVVIGVENFDYFCRGGKKSVELKRENGNRLLSFAKKGETDVYGVVHLSSKHTKVTQDEKDKLKDYFSDKLRQ